MTSRTVSVLVSIGCIIRSSQCFTPKETSCFTTTTRHHRNTEVTKTTKTQLPASSFVINRNESKENTGSKIDRALSEIQPLEVPITHNDDIMEEMHGFLSDGHGHLNSELARSIWDWENSQRIISRSSSSSFDENDSASSSNSRKEQLFPAAQLKFSTRRGLRLVDSIANELNHDDRYPDLIQEGVVALMSAMVHFDPLEGDEERFEAYAKNEIRTAMKTALAEGGSATKSRFWFSREVLQPPPSPPSPSSSSLPTTETVLGEEGNVGEVDRIIAPLSDFLAEDNPTPEDIALTDMIKHDIRDFLDRILDEKELRVVRMKFDLDGSCGSVVGGMSSLDIADRLGVDFTEVKKIESRALEKLRTSFSEDYIGAYIDHDYAEEVSL